MAYLITQYCFVNITNLPYNVFTSIVCFQFLHILLLKFLSRYFSILHTVAIMLIAYIFSLKKNNKSMSFYRNMTFVLFHIQEKMFIILGIKNN